MNATTNSVQLYRYDFGQVKTYLLATLFIAGNIIVPQLCHLMPHGGMIWLPIYFFTLIASYKYGLKVGLLTALLSPLVNSVLFAMPATSMLPIITVKSALLAVAASVVAQRAGRVSLLLIALAVVSYQAVGSLAEWAMTGSIASAMQDLRLGWPGMLVQIFGGYLFIRLLLRK